MSVIHILNGDALNEQFPDSILGERIVARFCLVDGDVKANSLDELITVRSRFISKNYGGVSEKEYFEKSVSEIRKIQNIEEDFEINLWFEDDLFCQVNFWFVSHLLNNQNKNQAFFLIRPIKNNPYSFGNMNEIELINAYQKKLKVDFSELIEFGKLWNYYQRDSISEMLNIANKNKAKYPFLCPAIQAHRDRFSDNGGDGRPEQSLKNIMKELQTKDFGQIFNAFCAREGIYGFGDVQVKRIFDRIINRKTF